MEAAINSAQKVQMDSLRRQAKVGPNSHKEQVNRSQQVNDKHQSLAMIPDLASRLE